ncbi:MAG: HAD family hydrolase [Opitutales bacterium]
MRHCLVLFDLDGTLIDHFGAIHRCHAFAMRQVGLPEPTPAQVRAAVGGGLEHAIARLAGPDNVATVLPHYLAHWKETMLDDVVPLPGAGDLLTAIRAASGRSAVLTNKRGDAARAVCAHLGLTPLLAGIIGAGDTPWLKPDRALTFQVLAGLGSTPGEACYVGDSPFDIATAREAGLPFYGVTTGTHHETELRAAGAENVFPGLPELQAALA